MMDAVTLATAAVGAVVPYLAAGGTEVAKTAAKDLYGWLKGKLTLAGQEALADVETAPEDADAQATLRVQLRKLIEAEPSLAADLARLVEALPAAGHSQTATVSGKRHTVTQVIGSGNRSGM
jgi:hypothetical protein